MSGSPQNLGSIGSTVLTFIGHKRTEKQTDRQAKYIHRLNPAFVSSFQLEHLLNWKTIPENIFRI